jgi:hypothetical protein
MYYQVYQVRMHVCSIDDLRTIDICFEMTSKQCKAHAHKTNDQFLTSTNFEITTGSKWPLVPVFQLAQPKLQ